MSNATTFIGYNQARAGAEVNQTELLDELETSQTLAETYKVVNLLGEGGMSYVFLAEHSRLRRLVALKVMKTNIGLEKAGSLFREEAKLLRSLNHPSLTKFLDFAIHQGKYPLLAMELVRGETLAERIERLGPMKTEQALPLFKQIAEGLAYVHLKGLVHNDLKPGNIMLVGGETGGEKSKELKVKILDFGISRLISFRSTEESIVGSSGSQKKLLIGSPLYMAPEQWNDEEITPRVDLYAFGCCLYEALSGRAPYEADTIAELARLHEVGSYPGLCTNEANQDYPIALDICLRRLLAKSPQERYRSAQEVVGVLDTIFTKIAKRKIKEASPADRLKQRPYFLIGGLTTLVVLSGIVYYVSGFKESNSGTVSSRSKASYSINSRSVKTSTKPQTISPNPSLNAEGSLDHKSNFQYLLEMSKDKHLSLLFPEDESLGYLCSAENKCVEMKGRTQLHLSDPDFCEYRPSVYASRKPAMLDGLVEIPITRVKLNAVDETYGCDFLEVLPKFKNLNYLFLNLLPLDKTAIQAIGRIKQLKSLLIWSPEMSQDYACKWGEDLALTANLKSLKHLCVSEVAPVNPLLRALSSSEELESLTIISSSIDKEACVSLGKNKTLKDLKLDLCRFPSGGFQEISNLPSLTKLVLGKCNLPPEAAVSMLKAPALKEFYIQDPQLVNAELLKQAAMKNSLHSFEIFIYMSKMQTAQLQRYKDFFAKRKTHFDYARIRESEDR